VTLVSYPNATAHVPTPPVAADTLYCPICGLPVDWQDAVATSGDHVVHAWCHPHFSKFWPADVPRPPRPSQ
jgi:hypothetical protein